MYVAVIVKKYNKTIQFIVKFYNFLTFGVVKNAIFMPTRVMKLHQINW